MKFSFSKSNSESVRHYSLNFNGRRKSYSTQSTFSVVETDTDHVASQISIKETFTYTLSVVSSQASFSHKDSLIRPRGSGKIYLSIHRVKELCQQSFPKWSQEWYVITIKMKYNVTQRCIETRQGQYYWKFSENMDYKICRKSLSSTYSSRK